MEIKILQEKLAKALNTVSRVAAGSRATLPILNNVLIRVDDNKVSLTTTNLDMAVVSYLPASQSKNGVITAPARLMAEFVGNLPHGEVVEIGASADKVTIKAGGYTSTINGTPADDFPELPEIDESKVVKFQMSAEDFKAGLSQVMIAASSDTTRPALTGVYFNTFEGSLYLAATDGYRLAERKFIEKVNSDVMAIVPAASLQEVLRSLSDDVTEIELWFDEAQVRFRLGEIEITSKLIDGSFPDYRQLIPKQTEINLGLKRDELVRITKLAALFAKEVGAWLPPGIGEGVKKAMPQLDNDMRNQLQDLVDDANLSVAAEVSGFSNKLAASSYTSDKYQGEPSTVTNNNGIVINLTYNGTSEPMDIKKISRQLGIETAREMRRRGIPAI